MSVARTDARFLLPEPVRSAAVLDGVDGWDLTLAGVGIDLVAPEHDPDLVVAPAARWRDAVGSGARGIVLEGADRRTQLRRWGLPASAHLPAPNAVQPILMVPLGTAHVARYALTRMAAPRSLPKALRNRLLGRALGSGARFPGVPVVTVAGAAGSAPWLVEAAAQELGLDGELDWLLVPGQGDLLARSTMQLFPPRAREPRWALKFARVRDHAEPFERDERGLAVAAAGGSAVQRHSPRLVARFAVDGFEASLETAAIGPTLTAHLHGRASRTRKIATLQAIAAWVVEIATSTAAPPEALAPELDGLAEQVVPRWGLAGTGLDPRARLAGVPATLQHNDLGSWNIVVDGADFTALDWEDARPHGAPLWDLLYMLMDALAHLDGVPNAVEEREHHFAALFRGELESSRLLFHWLREAVARLELPREAVPELAALCWMDHGVPPEGRQEALWQHDEDAPPGFWPQVLERFARRWLTDPGLGRRWPAWHAG
jgi:hypothetical protein